MKTYSFNNVTIQIDPRKDRLISEAGMTILKDRYFLKTYNKETKAWIMQEESPQEVFARSACVFGSNAAHAQRLYNYASDMWFMFSTPILSNAGSKKGLPISCFLGAVEDSRGGIVNHIYENAFLSSYGGGIGGDWSALRANGQPTSTGNVSTGIIPFIKMVDAEVAAFMQGSARRGAYAAYLDVSHPEIEEFIDVRNPFGGDLNRRCMGAGFHHAVCIPDSFMECVSNGTPWNLVDPSSGEVTKTIDARTLWLKILTNRIELGEPYLFFSDTANRALPPELRRKGLRINCSNLCNEIMLPTSPERTAVCCLSSVNLEYYDIWKEQPDFIPDIVEMLDNVLDYFCANAPKEMWRAIKSAQSERSIGLGAMGFHLLLQKKGIPFESAMAVGLNRKVFDHVKTWAGIASKSLACLRGEAPDMVGTGLRFSHLLALAPNANIASICGNTSPSIEPFNSNGYKWNTLSGSFLIKNKELDKILKIEYNLQGQKYDEVWSSIITNQGSVQHLDFLSVLHKEVFKTAFELDQNWIIEHAAQRQPFICQGQSVNLFLQPDIHKNELHQLHFKAWRMGLKGLYYCRSKAIRPTENISETPRPTPKKKELTLYELKEQYVNENENSVSFVDETKTCISCEG